MYRHSCLAVLFSTVCLSLSEAVFFNATADCLVSQWSVWSEPYGFGTVSRHRAILRYPNNGGNACPTDLIETRLTSKAKVSFSKLINT